MTGTEDSETIDVRLMSKSQKKRMKRKASEARKQAAETQSSPPPASEDTLTPHAKLRADLVKLGFKLNEIDMAMDEMWNLQMRYDEFDSVLNYMQSKNETSEKEDITSNIVVDVAAEMEVSATTETDTTISRNTPSNKIISDDTAQHVADINTEELSEKTAALSMEHAPTTGPECHIEEAESDVQNHSLQPNGLSTRLDLVANHKDLAESLAALTEWVLKAAKPHEIEELYLAKSTRALPLVLRRSILEPSAINVTGQVLDLINSIFRSAGLSSGIISLTTKILGPLLIQTRGLLAIDTCMDNDKIASTVADSIVSSIAISLNRFRQSPDVRDVVNRMENEIKQVVSSVIPNGGGVMELMTIRERNKTIVEKYDTIMKLTIDKISSRSKIETTKRNIALLGDNVDDVFASQKQCKVLKEALEKVNSVSFKEREILCCYIENCQTEQTQVVNRMADLQSEMERLKNKDQLLSKQIADTRPKLCLLEESLSGEALKLQQKLNEEIEKTKMGECALDIEAKLEEFILTLEKGVSNITFSDNGNLVPDVLKETCVKINTFLKNMKKYFEAEANIIDFLKERVQKLVNDLPNLRNMEEYSSLGMITDLTKMKQERENIRANIDDDNNACDALQAEALKMQILMVTHLDNFLKSSCVENEMSCFELVHRGVFTEVIVSMKRINLPSNTHTNIILNKFLHKINPHEMEHTNNTLNGTRNALNDIDMIADEVISQQMISSKINTYDVDEVEYEHIPDTPARVPSIPIAPVVKKFGWGQQRKTNDKPVKSLLDIQKEELTLKSGS